MLRPGFEPGSTAIGNESPPNSRGRYAWPDYTTGAKTDKLVAILYFYDQKLLFNKDFTANFISEALTVFLPA